MTHKQYLVSEETLREARRKKQGLEDTHFGLIFESDKRLNFESQRALHPRLVLFYNRYPNWRYKR